MAMVGVRELWDSIVGEVSRMRWCRDDTRALWSGYAAYNTSMYRCIASQLQHRPPAAIRDRTRVLAALAVIGWEEP